MKFASTRDNQLSVSFEDAMLHGLAPDKGLYVPSHLPYLSRDFLQHLPKHTLPVLAATIMRNFITKIPAPQLQIMLDDTLNFPIPLIHLDENFYLLEVFHGPTLSFKDVGARFMARALSYYMHAEHRKVTILVATSGDTGSAIAHAFHHMPNINVYILYPSKKISLLQEMQITTFGGNVHALEVEGTFDDCQRLVKTALMDASLKTKSIVTTSNSINIARLLPQIIYHAWGLTQLQQQGVTATPISIVPSGNLGNLTSAIYANHIGFPVKHFVSALNINSVFADYLATSQFTPQPSKKTLANAMDVGNPSNFERLLNIYGNDHRQMRDEVTGISIPDETILAEIKNCYEKTGYILDPHTAVGMAAAKQYKTNDDPMIITATAHPAKFPEVIKSAIHIDIELPEQLRMLTTREKQAEKIGVDYSDLHGVLSR